MNYNPTFLKHQILNRPKAGRWRISKSGDLAQQIVLFWSLLTDLH